MPNQPFHTLIRVIRIGGVAWFRCLSLSKRGAVGMSCVGMQIMLVPGLLASVLGRSLA